MTTTASIMMEDGNQNGDSDSASKNMGSFVKINSISIDLADVNDKSYVTKCEHFSIREYVSEVRKKNWKLCWPFALDDEQNKLKEQTPLLPPLTSPKFRWWSCKSCRQEIGCGGAEKGHVTRSNNFSVVSKSKSDCSQMPSPCTAAMHLPAVRQASKTNLMGKRRSDVRTSIDVITKNKYEVKKALTVTDAHTSFIGPEKDSVNDVGHELPSVAFVTGDTNVKVMQEKPKYDTESQKLEDARPFDLCKLSRDVTDGVLATPMGMCIKSTKMCIVENPNSVGEELNKLHIASGPSVLACSNDGAANAVKGDTDAYVYGLSDECDNASSDSVEIVKSNLQDCNQSSPSGLQRRKARKVRLLTDLLFDNGDTKTEHAIKDVSLLSAVNSTSTGTGVVSVPQDQVSVLDSCREDLDGNKKRKLPLGEEWRTPEMSSPINLNKKVKNFKDSEGTTHAMTDSEIKGVASTGLYVQAVNRTHWNKYGSDSILITEKKNKKKEREKEKGQITDSCSYLVPVGEHFPNQGVDQFARSSKGNGEDVISFRAEKDSFSCRGMEKIPLAPRKEKKPSLCKSKSKMPQFDDGQPSQYPWNNSGLLKKVPITRNEENVQTGPVTVSFHQAEDASIDTGLQLSLGSSAAPKKCSRKYTPEVGNGISPMYWQESAPMDETMKKNVERNYISESAIPSKSGSFGYFKKRVHGDVNGQLITYDVPVLNDKQNTNSHIEEGRRFLGKQVDISDTRNCQKTIKAKEHSAVSRKHVTKIADQVSDNVVSDDIPMDIVELLARIQYERGQQDPENNRSILKAAKDGRSSPMLDYDRVYSAEKFRISEEASKQTNSQTRKGRNDITTAKKDVKSSKQKSVDYLPNVNGDYLNGSHLGQKKSSSSLQLAATSPTECSCAQNCHWNASMMGRSFFNAGACDTCPIVPRATEEAEQIWPSAIPLERPTRYNVPQNGTPQRTNLMVSSGHCLSPKGDLVNRVHELKYSKNSATNLEIPGQHIGSQTFSRRNAEYLLVNKHNGIEHQQNLRGSLDLYTNETIPAMHLLSLMTAGMPSGTTFNTGGNARFLERDFPPDNSSKEYPQMHIGVYSKPRDTVKHPLNYHGKNQVSVKPHDFFPVNPIAGPSTSFRHQKGFETANDFMGQVSFSSRGKEKVQKSLGAPSQSTGLKPLNYAFSSGGCIPNCNAIPADDVHKGFPVASSSMAPPLQTRPSKYTTELKLGTPHAAGTFRPLKRRSESLICCVNQNPADFSFPEAENEYMIRGEDLKVGNPRKRRVLTTADQRKRQKNVKHNAAKDQA